MWDYMQLAWENYTITFERVVVHHEFYRLPNGLTKWDVVMEKIPVSLILNMVSLVIYVPVGIGLGIISAVYRGKLVDKIISSFSLVLGSVPSFIVIIFMIILFGFRLDMFPPLFLWGEWYNQYIIPVASLVLYPIAKIITTVRGEIIETLETDEVLLLKAKGLNRRQIIFRHLFRQSLVSVFPQVTDLFLYVIMMSFIVEKTYQIPGVAKLFLDSIVVSGEFSNMVNMDLMYVALISAFYILLILVVNLLNDILATIIDPRIQLSKNRQL